MILNCFTHFNDYKRQTALRVMQILLSNIKFTFKFVYERNERTGKPFQDRNKLKLVDIHDSKILITLENISTDFYENNKCLQFHW